MQYLMIIVALMMAVLVGDVFAQQPVASPEQRLALEIAALQMRNAYLGADLDKAKMEIEALKAKLSAPAESPK